MPGTDRERDRGSAGVETAGAVVALLSVGFFVIGALRVTGSGGDVTAAAHAGARAAAAERDFGSAQTAAYAVASGVLADRGVACADLAVAVGGSLAPGGVVEVDVSCVVQMADVGLGGFHSDRTVSARGVELVDVIRGGG